MGSCRILPSTVGSTFDQRSLRSTADMSSPGLAVFGALLLPESAAKTWEPWSKLLEEVVEGCMNVCVYIYLSI